MSKKSSPLSRKGLSVFALLAAAMPGLPAAAGAAPECTPKPGTTGLPAECRTATNPCAPGAMAKPSNPCAPAAKAKPANPCAPARKAKPTNPCAPSRADR